MTRQTRQILLYSTTLFFILFVPVILLYAWGYSFDWQKTKPVLTGGLYLRTIPKKAEVYLNDKFIEETPVFIKRLVPRDYQVKITKEGFHAWQKKLQVESKLVTEVKNIFLIPFELKTEIINEKLPADFSLEEFLPQEKSDDIFYIHKPSYILYRTDSDESFQEQISLAPLPNNQEYEIFVSSNKIIAALSTSSELYLLAPEKRTFELISRDVQAVRFSDDNKKLLYFTPSEIWVYYLEDTRNQLDKKANEKELITRLSQRIKQVIWYPETDEHIIFLVGDNIKIIELDGRDQRNIVDLIKIDTDQIAYHQENERLYIINGDKLLSLSLGL